MIRRSMLVVAAVLLPTVVGAQTRTIRTLFVRRGLIIAATGLAIGVVGAAVFTRVMESLLFEIRPNDPATLAGVAALITAVAASASLVPAVRATRVNPIVALKDE